MTTETNAYGYTKTQMRGIEKEHRPSLAAQTFNDQNEEENHL